MEPCYLCLGSNEKPHVHVEFARQMLSRNFSDIIFAQEEMTEPEGMNNPAKFVNQVALFYSDWEYSRLKKLMKSIEIAAGRTELDKSREIVKLDIDILKYGNTVYKSSDLARPYVKRGMEELSEKSDIL